MWRNGKWEAVPVKLPDYKSNYDLKQPDPTMIKPVFPVDSKNDQRMPEETK
jgi:hypothetical protein